MLPTHGFGSFCSATQSDATESTIGREKQHNPVLTCSEQDYVDALLDGLDAYPAYYVHMAPANSAGPAEPDLTPPAQARPAELRRRIEAGEWVVDLRTRTVFAAGHVPGSLNFGLDGGFATYLGWLIDWGTPLTLLGETEADVATAQRELVRIGIDRPAAAATGGPQDWTDQALASFPRATFADLDHVRHHRDVVVLDVRRTPEFAAARIEGALNIPLHELPRRVDEVPDAEVWVHCAGGYRASVAASFLSGFSYVKPLPIDEAPLCLGRCGGGGRRRGRDGVSALIHRSVRLGRLVIEVDLVPGPWAGLGCRSVRRFHFGSLVVPSPAGGQVVAGGGGPVAAACRASQPVAQGQCVGRWSTRRRPVCATRAGTLMIFARRLAQRRLARPAATAAARARLNAITAQATQAAFAG